MSEYAATERGHHATKVTVYMSEEELLRLDHQLLEMRRLYGVKLDRSWYVREALGIASMRRIAERVREIGPVGNQGSGVRNGS